MKNINKTRNSFSIKLIFFSLVTVLFLISCEQNSNKNESLNEKLINIYKLEIKTKLAEIEELIKINPPKYLESFHEIQGVQLKFDSIYRLIEENNLNIHFLLKEIYDQTKNHYKYNTANKIDAILNTNTTSIDSKELQTILLELNSTIISQIRDDVGRTDYKFNKIDIFVIPEERVIKVGETYKGHVVIGAVDSTALPTISYEDQSKQLKSGFRLIEIKGEKKGKFKSKGEINLFVTDDGIENKYPFEFEYEVK